MKPICILGCGPAGLLAAHAVGLAGYPMVIMSRPEKSRLGGAQFLHMAIPQITGDEPEETITYTTRGDATTYKEKVYGEDPTIPFVSFPEDGKTQGAWNLLRVYDALWSIFGESLNPTEVTPMWLDEHATDFDLIISSIPAPQICRAKLGLINEVHSFNGQRVWIHPECVNPSVPDNTIEYDGTRDHGYYRMSRLFGVGGTEWSDLGPKPPIQPLIPALKPISTSCDCYPDIVRVGRHGTWTKGQLTHHAFIEALRAVLPPREVEEAISAL